MPIIKTLNREIIASKGIHLYHFWLSSCSQRVRVVLAEKNIDWVSHSVDLQNKENSTEEFQSINPKGLVPILVHDGKVIVESIDIIQYLDENFPEPSLKNEGKNEHCELLEWLNRADAAQHSLKTLTHEFLFKPDRMTAKQLTTFLKNHKNKELQEFMKVFCSDEGFSKNYIEAELKHQHDEFVALNHALDGQEWLVGNSFSLADIAWIPNVRRMEIMMYPLNRHPNLLAWYERFKKRPCYNKGITEFEIAPALEHFLEYNLQRVDNGNGITAFEPLNR